MLWVRKVPQHTAARLCAGQCRGTVSRCSPSTCSFSAGRRSSGISRCYLIGSKCRLVSQTCRGLSAMSAARYARRRLLTTLHQRHACGKACSHTATPVSACALVPCPGSPCLGRCSGSGSQVKPRRPRLVATQVNLTPVSPSSVGIAYKPCVFLSVRVLRCVNVSMPCIFIESAACVPTARR